MADKDTWKQIINFLKDKLDPDALNELTEILGGGSADSLSSGAMAGLRELQQAQTETRDVMSAQDAMACDSIAGIYKTALTRIGVPIPGVSATAALRQIFLAHRQRGGTYGRSLAMDSAAINSLEERFPHAAKIQVAV